MGRVIHGAPMDLVAALVDGLGLQTIVETGTFEGESAAAFRGLVNEVWTVELSDDQRARAEANNAGLDHIHYFAGESPAALAEMAKQIEGPALFWCDAHALPYTEPTDSAMPILEELQAIETFKDAGDSCILIDDARLFMAPQVHYPGFELPLIAEVFEALRQRDRYVTVLRDVVIAVPPAGRAIVDRWWLESVDGKDEVDFYCDRWIAALTPTPTEAAKLLFQSVKSATARKLGLRS
jgi:hypothetical protein